MKIGHFHHGYAPSAEIVEALAKSAIAVCGRNADFFEPGSIEKFDKVIVDKGVNTKAIREAYGDKVVDIEDLLGASPAPADKKKLNADAPVNPTREARAQGEPAKGKTKVVIEQPVNPAPADKK